jgi:hypothetical protein
LAGTNSYQIENGSDRTNGSRGNNTSWSSIISEIKNELIRIEALEEKNCLNEYDGDQRKSDLTQKLDLR